MIKENISFKLKILLLICSFYLCVVASDFNIKNISNVYIEFFPNKIPCKDLEIELIHILSNEKFDLLNKDYHLYPKSEKMSFYLIRKMKTRSSVMCFLTYKTNKYNGEIIYLTHILDEFKKTSKVDEEAMSVFFKCLKGILESEKNLILKFSNKEQKKIYENAFGIEKIENLGFRPTPNKGINEDDVVYSF
jgi:hypothetical protein